MYLCQHGVTLKYVSPIEIVIIGGAQFKHMLNIGTVPLLLETVRFDASLNLGYETFRWIGYILDYVVHRIGPFNII